MQVKTHSDKSRLLLYLALFSLTFEAHDTTIFAPD